MSFFFFLFLLFLFVEVRSVFSPFSQVVVGVAAQEEAPAGTLAPAEPVNLDEKVIALHTWRF
jgi:hypothetical protein